MELFDKDGQRFFMHTITDEEKAELSEEDKAHLLPSLDPYDNKLVMPLKVRVWLSLCVCLCVCVCAGGRAGV